MADSVPFQDILQHQREAARDQLAEAWGLHAARLQEEIRKGWQDHLAIAFEERLRLLSDGVEEELQRRLSLRQAELRASSMADADRQRQAARKELASELNQAVRRLAQAADATAWTEALLDGLQPLSNRVVFFSLTSGRVRCVGARPAALPELEVAIAEAPAFGSVVESEDTVVVAVSPRELSTSVFSELRLHEIEKAYLLPILGSQQRKVIGVVLMAPNQDAFDLNLAEMFCSLAGPLRKTPASNVGVVVQIAPAPNERPKEQEELAQRAQRFARVKVAELRLYQSQTVIDGRASKTLYTGLRGDIDLARSQYRDEFLAAPGLPDYLHEELVKTLANNDVALMGAEYPGALA